MNKKLKQLREEYKAAFGRYLAYRSEMFVSTNIPVRPVQSMRAFHKHAKAIISNTPANLTRSEYREVSSEFVRAGDIYYHAKKYGLDSAMLFKLSLI